MAQTFILHVGLITVAGIKIDAFKSKFSIMTQAVIVVLYLVRSASRLELIDNSRGTRYSSTCHERTSSGPGKSVRT